MNFKTKLNINSNCDCSIILFLRNIIEKGLKPILQNISTIAVTSLTNTALFGNYENIDYLFVLGNVFDIPYSSIIYTAYNVLLQDTITAGIESKGKDTQGIILQEQFYPPMQLSAHSKPYTIYKKFTTGTINLVSRKTYAIRFQMIISQGKTGYAPFSCTGCEEDNKNFIIDGGKYLVFLQKGQPIPSTGLAIQFIVDAEIQHLRLYAGNYLGLSQYCTIITFFFRFC